MLRTAEFTGQIAKREGIPGQSTHPGPFRDNGKKSGSVPDVPGQLATMCEEAKALKNKN